MSDQSYRVEIDRQRRLVTLTVHAMLSPEDGAWAGEELRAAIQTLGADIGRHVTLYDMSAVAALPTATVDMALRAFDNAAVRALWARKVALVVGTATGRMQASRLAQVRRDIGIFASRDAAIAWLLDPDQAPPR